MFVPDVVTGHWLEPQLKLVNSLADYYSSKRALVIHGALSEILFKKNVNDFSKLDVLFFRSSVTRTKMINMFSDRLPHLCPDGL